jgi:glucose/arabinose dehydrogenase
MIKIRNRNKIQIVFLIFIIFNLGVITVIAFPIDKISSFKLSILEKLRITQPRIIYPEKLETSRYEFSLQKQLSLNGIFQLAPVSKSYFYALDRFSGELFSFKMNNKESKRNYLGNVYDQSNFLYNGKGSKSGQKINNAGNKISNDLKIFATAFDLEYAFGQLYMSVTLPSEDQTCTSLNLLSFIVPYSASDKLKKPKVLFKSPCILDKSSPTMWGGRITHSTKSIFMSIGEQRYDPSGFPKADKLSISEIKNNSSVFGKVLEFNPKIGTYKIYSSGHRNTQGLFFSNDEGKLFESEHGPFGGDEVNILIKGKNYGWPFGTFGKPYPLFDTGNKNDEFRSINPSSTIDKQLSNFGAKSGSQPKAQLPIMSWIPSVGAGNLAKIQNNSSYSDWLGNIFVSTMLEKSIHRLILSRNSVVLDERIPIGLRIRDFIINDFGFIILSTDEGKLLFYKATSPDIVMNK